MIRTVKKFLKTGISWTVKIGMNKKNFPKRGDVYGVNLDPTIGSEINKTRPGVIVSNDAANQMSLRVIVAPITSKVTTVYAFQTKVTVNGKDGKALLDQVRSVDKKRLTTKIGTISKEKMKQVDQALRIALGINS